MPGRSRIRCLVFFVLFLSGLLHERWHAVGEHDAADAHGEDHEDGDHEHLLLLSNKVPRLEVPDPHDECGFATVPGAVLRSMPGSIARRFEPLPEARAGPFARRSVPTRSPRSPPL